MNDLPKRRAPIHLSPREVHNRPTIIFLTVCTAERKSILANTGALQLLVAAWEQANQWQVGRFVIMPDHVHLFCTRAQTDVCPLVTWVRFWKSQVSKRWPVRDDLPLWQQNYWDRQLRSDENYDDKWHYVRNNPLRHGLVKQPEDWPYQGEMNLLPWF